MRLDDEGPDADAEQAQSTLDLSPSAGAQIAGVIGSGTGLFTGPESTARSANASFNVDILEQGLGKISVVTAVVVDDLTGQVFTGRVAGALVGTGVPAVDQVQAYNRGEVTGVEAIGTVTAGAATVLAAEVSGATAGALIGSVIPGAGTLVGGAVGFGVGLAAGYGADMALRASGVKDAIASSVLRLHSTRNPVHSARQRIRSAAEVVPCRLLSAGSIRTMNDYQANGFTSSLLEPWEDRSTITLVGNLSENGFASNLVVTRQQLKAGTGTSAADFAHSQLKELASQVQQSTVESQRTFKNNHGYEVFQQISKFSLETRYVKQVQAFLSDDSPKHATVFVITGTASPSTFARALPQFQHFIEQFQAMSDER